MQMQFKTLRQQLTPNWSSWTTQRTTWIEKSKHTTHIRPRVKQSPAWILSILVIRKQISHEPRVSHHTTGKTFENSLIYLYETSPPAKAEVGLLFLDSTQLPRENIHVFRFQFQSQNYLLYWVGSVVSKSCVYQKLSITTARSELYFN